MKAFAFYITLTVALAMLSAWYDSTLLGLAACLSVWLAALRSRSTTASGLVLGLIVFGVL